MDGVEGAASIVRPRALDFKYSSKEIGKEGDMGSSFLVILKSGMVTATDPVVSSTEK